MSLLFQVFHSFKRTSSCHTLEIKPAMKRKRLLRKASECQNDPTNRFGALLKAPMYLPMREAFKMLNIMPILLEFSQWESSNLSEMSGMSLTPATMFIFNYFNNY